MVANILLALNTLKPIDVVFFIVCAVAIAVGVAIYFLIPVINHKQYDEQRENLKKREDAFKSSHSVSKNSVAADQSEIEVAADIPAGKENK